MTKIHKVRFGAPAAQGDVCFLARKGKLPEGAKPVTPEREDKHIVAHSETGHHHTVDLAAGQLFSNPSNPFLFHFVPDKKLFDGALAKPVLVEHERPTHTHETLALELLADGGADDDVVIDIYHQFNPAKLRRVAD